MRSRLPLSLLAAAVLIAPLAPAQAITNGEPDRDAHPFVGQMLFYDPSEPDPRWDEPGGWFSCSGALVNDSHVVTAGHCTYGIGLEGEATDDGSGGNDVWINFSEVPDLAGFPPSSDYTDDRETGNSARYGDREAWLDEHSGWIRATSHPSPDYNPGAFFLADLGVLVLEKTVQMDANGELPTEGLIDRLYKADRTATYTPVGYGLEKSMPWGSFGGDRRNVATVKINSLNGAYGLGKGIAVAYSSNKGKPHRGGTCFGDSGGPTFPVAQGYEKTIITVTSFGIDPNCKAGGGGYRIDQADDLDWLESEFGLVP
jgi:hypothetical protein